MHIIWYRHFGIMAAHCYAGCIVRWTHATMKFLTMSRVCGASGKHNAMRLLRCTFFDATLSAKRAVISSAMPLTVWAERVRNA